MLNFSDEALSQYRASESCQPLLCLYSELEQPLVPGDNYDDDDGDDNNNNSDMKTIDNLLPQQPAQKVRVLVNDPPPSASVFKLFGYFHESWQQALALPYDDIRETVQSRLGGTVPQLADEVVQCRPQLERAIKTFVQRMVLELFTVDERGAKIRQIMGELEETYLLGEPVKRVAGGGGGGGEQPQRRVVRNGRANFINADAIHRATKKTYEESMSGADDFYKKCSDAKKRGRRPSADKNQQPDRIDQIKAGHILSQKSVAPITYSETDERFYTMANAIHDAVATNASYGLQSTVDFYPVFLKVLSNFYHCIPSAENHGIYLLELNRAVRLLTPQQWPMLGLVKSLMNAEQIYPLRKVSVPLSTTTTYRCAYSGAQLKPGEQVWLLRILVCDGARYTKWVTESKLPPQPMTAPEFTRSLRAYFVRPSVVSARSLFYAAPPAQQAKKEFVPPPTPRKPLASVDASSNGGQRIICVNTLWVVLNQLRHFVQQEELAQHIYSVHQRRVSYQLLLKQLVDLLDARDVTRDQIWLHTVPGALFIGTLINDMPHWSVQALLSNEEARRYVAMLQDAVLDFVDLMFPHHGGGGGGVSPASGAHMMRRTFSLHRLGVRADEKTKIPATLAPVLRNPDGALLACLLAQSDARGRSAINGATTYDEKVCRMERLEQLVTRHPLVFMALFQVLYEPHALAPQQQLSLKKALRYLHAMGLFINTDPALLEQPAK